MAAKRTAKKTKRIPPSARRVRGGLKCPECGFIAKHAMGLGRHRSSRHGVASVRSARKRSSGRWVSRQQAAERAGVHYNTLRQWEHANIVRTSKRPGIRGVLVNMDDLEKFLVERGGYTAIPEGGVSDAAVKALQGRYDRLIADLEQLLETAKASRPTTTKSPRGRPKGKAGAKKRTAKKRTARKRTARKRTAKRAPKRSGARKAKRARR